MDCINKKCPAYTKCLAPYRGSRCKSTRAIYGLGDPITNADRIRAMMDEELADFIARQRFSVVNPIADKLGIDVTTEFIVGRKNALDWLKQEVDDG